MALVRMADCYSDDVERQASPTLGGRNAARIGRMNRPSDVYKGSEDLTGLCKDDDA